MTLEETIRQAVADGVRDVLDELRSAGAGEAHDDVRLVSVQEAADRLDLSTSRIYELLDVGEMPSVKLGARRLIRLRDLNEYVDRHEQPARLQVAS